MAKAPDDSNSAKNAVKKSGVSPTAAAAAGSAAAPAKKKLTAAEAKKKLKGKSGADGSKVAPAADPATGGGARKKPVPQMNLPRDLSKQVGLKKDGESDAADAAPARPPHDRNVAIHTTNRDARENRKVRSLLVLAALIAAGVIALVVWLQLRDPEAGGKARILALEMDHYRQILARHPEIIPGPNGQLTPAAVVAELARQLDAQFQTAGGDPKKVVSPADNPELYSLDLARQFMDPYGKPIRVSLPGGKIAIRSFGPDGIDQTGDAPTAQGDDQVVCE